MKGPVEKVLLDSLQNCNSEEWNKSLSCRLEAVRAFLGHDEWVKGISVYLQASLGKCLEKLITEPASSESYHYARGFIAAIRLVVALPATVNAAIEQADRKNKSNSQNYTG